MARHPANHINVAYTRPGAGDPPSAAKAAMMAELGIESISANYLMKLETVFALKGRDFSPA